MPLLDAALLFVSGFLTGTVNAIAGGGTFLSFGALTLVGVPAVSANATSSITQFPGYVTSTLAYWSDIGRMPRGALALAGVSVFGSLAGALLLLGLSNPSFRALVPWLLVAATALFAAGPWLKPKPRLGATGEPQPPGNRPLGLLLQFGTAVYGGFFGAGMGVMMLATLGLTEGGDYHRPNALKNMLATVIAAVAILVFVGGGVVAWPQAVVMIPAVALGGWSGVWIARRVPQSAVRAAVIAIGLSLALYYFWHG